MANEGASASPVPETRHKAIWLRIGGGLTLISVLLALLALLDDRQAPAPDEADPPGLPASSEPAPNIVTEAREPLIGTAVALPEPQSPVPAVAEAEPGVSAVPVSEPAPEGSAAPEVVAPVARQADAPPPAAANAAAVAQGAAAAPEATTRAAPEPDDAAQPPAPKPQPEEARIASTKGGFLVQLGVFGVSGNAEALFAELKKQGVPARLETRVVAGPFPNRKSAEAARERLARAGLAKGIVVQSR